MKTENTPPINLNRRELIANALRLGAVSSGALAMAACGNSATPAAAASSTSGNCPTTPVTPVSCPVNPPGNFRIDVHTHHIPDFYRASLFAAGKFTAGGIPLPQWTPERHIGFMNSYPDLKLPTFLYEFTFDTTRTVVNMLYRQVFKTYPNIRWILSHAGGCVPFLSYRTSLLLGTPAVTQNLDAISPVPVVPENVPANADPAFASLYYDTALSLAPAAMKSVREVTSVDHVLFATDWPFSELVFPAAGSPLPLPTPLDPAPQLCSSFDGEERLMVERDNAYALFPRVASALA